MCFYFLLFEIERKKKKKRKKRKQKVFGGCIHVAVDTTDTNYKHVQQVQSMNKKKTSELFFHRAVLNEQKQYILRGGDILSYYYFATLV